MPTFLQNYTVGSYHPRANKLTQLLWYFTNAIFFSTTFFPFSFSKVFLLRLFGAKVGRGVNIKPSVNIKYPWNLQLGDYVWIGEQVWIDSLVKVSIGDHACISQGAMLLTGNHDFTTETFDLIVKEIVLESGVWIGAKAVVCPGVICHSHSILTVGSIATKNLEAYGIYQGNPAVKVKERVIT